MSKWLDRVKSNGFGALPKPIELRLMSASRISDPRLRMKKIDDAYAWSTDNYPHLFRD
jgi:hypothetical protein